jgi:hypothetical protein
MNSSNTFLIDNQSLPGRPGCKDVVVYRSDDKTLSVADTAFWKKKGFNTEFFNSFPRKSFGSRVENSRVMGGLINGSLRFEDL